MSIKLTIYLQQSQQVIKSTEVRIIVILIIKEG